MENVFPAVVDLNVGGERMTTLLTTLTKDKDSMLAAMFSGRHVISKDKDGRFFIDCDGNVFKYILNFLRFGTLPPAEAALKVYDLSSYFGLRSLTSALEIYRPVKQRKMIEEMKKSFDTERYEELKLNVINKLYETRFDPDENTALHIRSSIAQGCREGRCTKIFDQPFVSYMSKSSGYPALLVSFNYIELISTFSPSKYINRCLVYDLHELGFSNAFTPNFPYGGCFPILFLTNDCVRVSYDFWRRK